MSNFKFPKSERLTNKKRFERLFESGKTVKAFPLKLIYITEPTAEKEAASENAPPLQLAFTVPKRGFKKAVDRNYIRRRMKEAFRLNNSLLKENIDLNKEHLYAILIYTNRDKMEYHEIEKAWKKLMHKLVTNLQA